MKTTFIVVGKTVNLHLQALINDYADRIAHYVPFQCIVIPDLKNAKGRLTFEQQKKQEGEQILASFQAGDYIVLLDEGGKEYRSIDFADYLQKKWSTSFRRIVFVVGGPYGFSPEVYKAANEKLSLSKMTFSHQMIRLLFIEQFYRALTILNNEPYHHE